jgi:aldehyde dehydrogenase (NAD+)
MKTYLNFINGEWVASGTGRTLKSINPANFDEVVGEIQDSSKDDVNRAVAAAKAASKSWRDLPSAERSEGRSTFSF